MGLKARCCPDISMSVLFLFWEGGHTLRTSYCSRNTPVENRQAMMERPANRVEYIISPGTQYDFIVLQMLERVRQRRQN